MTAPENGGGGMKSLEDCFNDLGTAILAFTNEVRPAMSRLGEILEKSAELQEMLGTDHEAVVIPISDAAAKRMDDARSRSASADPDDRIIETAPGNYVSWSKVSAKLSLGEIHEFRCYKPTPKASAFVNEALARYPEMTIDQFEHEDGTTLIVATLATLGAS